MSYYLSEYLNGIYQEEGTPFIKLGKYEIRSYIDVDDNEFIIITECEELKLKHTEYLGIDIKLSDFPDDYEEINDCFKKMAKDIFEICKHENKKEIEKYKDTKITFYECYDCEIKYKYDEEYNEFEIENIDWK